MLSKEIFYKIRGHSSEQTVSEKIDQFFKHGNVFFLIELICLREEVKSLKEELHQLKEYKRHEFLRAPVVP